MLGVLGAACETSAGTVSGAGTASGSNLAFDTTLACPGDTPGSTEVSHYTRVVSGTTVRFSSGRIMDIDVFRPDIVRDVVATSWLTERAALREVWRG